MEIWDLIFIWLGRLTAFSGLLLFIRWLISIKYSKPHIVFGTPRPVDNSFGRTWYIPIYNARLRGFLGKVFRRRDIPKCRIRGEFAFSGQTRTHDWGTDPFEPISLPANSEPYELDLVNKRQGHPGCSITTQAMEDYQRLPEERTFMVTLSLIEGDKSLGTAAYGVENVGKDTSGLRVFHHTSNTLETEATQSINPLTLGILFFGFCITLLASTLYSPWITRLGWLAFALSVLMGVSILCPPLRRYLQTPRKWLWAFVFPLGLVAYIFSITINWLKALPDIPGLAFHLIFYLGFSWIFVITIVEASILRRLILSRAIAFPVLFLILALIRFVTGEWLAGIVLFIFGIGVLLAIIFPRWNIWDKLSF